MKLYYRPGSPFARKVRVVARELKIAMEEIEVDPKTSTDLHRANPLARVPTLVLDDGSTLFDSRVICEYLNATGNGRFFPYSIWKGNSGRWRALGLAALGDGISDSAVICFKENRLPFDERREDVLEYEKKIITNSIATLERFAPRFEQLPTMGEVSVACALGYVDFRLPDLVWRPHNPQLSAWFEQFSKYPSMVDTVPR